MNDGGLVKGQQRAVLVGLQLPSVTDQDHEATMAELGRLVHTLGYKVIGTVSQKRAAITAEAVIGEGKLREIARFTGGQGKVIHRIPGRRKKKKPGGPAGDHEHDDEDDDSGKSAGELARDALLAAAEEAKKIDYLPEDERAQFVIFDNELSPSQMRNLETACDCEVLDRTGVIVEIFYRHAKTREARLQVEIARLKYLAPRLKLARGATERTGAGIGAKGVGETAHELDKRRIRDRVAELSRELEEIHKAASGRRERRSEQQKIALVGYTNAGKSSLMRALTGSQVLVEDKLFATLDTTIRAMYPETTPRILVSDTVGFIKKLPHDLVASFRSTLDEAADASLLLYVADASDPTFRQQLAVTNEVIGEIGARDIPSRLILNKTDRLDAQELAILRAAYPDAILMSTHRAEDVLALRNLIITHFESVMAEATLLVPYTKGAMIGEIRKSVRVLSEGHDENGTTLAVRGPKFVIEQLTRQLSP